MEMWWLGFHIPPGASSLCSRPSSPAGRALAFHRLRRDGRPRACLGARRGGLWGRLLTAAGMLGLLCVLGPEWPSRSWWARSPSSPCRGPGRPAGPVPLRHPAKEQRQREASYAGHLFFMIVGALYLAMTVAPTEEMSLIGYSMTDLHALFAMALSVPSPAFVRLRRRLPRIPRWSRVKCWAP